MTGMPPTGRGEGTPTASLLRLAAALGTRDPILIESTLAASARSASPGEVDEVLLMSVFVTGFPAGLSALAAWSRVRPPGPRSRDTDAVDPAPRGEEVCRAVYGSQYEGLVDRLAELHPDLPHFVVTIGYGAMMGRPALPLQTRELCMVAMLVPWDAEPQLYSHLRGALEAGAKGSEVEASIRAGAWAARATDPRADEVEARARSTWQRVVRKRTR